MKIGSPPTGSRARLLTSVDVSEGLLEEERLAVLLTLG